MARFGLSALISLFAIACAPQDTLQFDEPELDDTTTGNPVDDTALDDTSEPAPTDPLNLSFEEPPLADGEIGRPAAWEADERNDAGAYAVGDIDGADHGAQYLALQIDGSGASWVTSPELAVLEEGVPVVLTFSIRSDCTGSMLTMLVDGRTDSFAILPVAGGWADVSFSITPDADQDGGAFTVEMLAESNSACALEIDHVRVD